MESLREKSFRESRAMRNFVEDGISFFVEKYSFDLDSFARIRLNYIPILIVSILLYFLIRIFYLYIFCLSRTDGTNSFLLYVTLNYNKFNQRIIHLNVSMINRENNILFCDKDKRVNFIIFVSHFRRFFILSNVWTSECWILFK